jgi:DNA-directed RNA polymerase specialized sigma24 family protein
VAEAGQLPGEGDVAAWLWGIAIRRLVSRLRRRHGMWLFLIVAPLIPCVAVAVSYDPGIDPALQPDLVTPYPALRLVLLRAVAVLVIALPVVALAGLLVPGWAPSTWLLPAFGKNERL